MNEQQPQQPFFIPLSNFVPQQMQSVQHDEPPARVLTALSYLRLCMQKTDNKIAVNDMAIEEFDRQELDIEEKKAMRDACMLMSQYFNGKLQPNEWEKRNKEQGRGTFKTLLCPVCLGPGKADCLLCEGAGRLLCQPAERQ